MTMPEIPSWLVALISGGGIGGLLAWRKPMAETNKIDAETEKLRAETARAKIDAENETWGHMREITDQLRRDVATLLEGRADNIKRIEHLEDAIEACNKREAAGLKREKNLSERIAALEALIPIAP
jgi:transposase